jgi:hypothetical protein
MLGYSPATRFADGIEKFVRWHNRPKTAVAVA